MTETEPTPDTEPKQIRISDMRNVQYATIKFRGIMIHADCMEHECKLLVLVHCMDGCKMLGTIVNCDDTITPDITRHQLTMWLHKSVKTLKMQEIDVQ